MKRGYGISLCFMFLAVSCDIPGRLVLKNQSGSQAKVRFHPSNSETLPFTLDLSPDGEGSKRELIYGFGDWFVGRRLEEHILRYRQVDIVTQRDSISITDTAQFRTWYTDGRRGRKFICVWVIK